ncbi:hypothetical protein ACFL59_00045 [Planctomycetota bacterium]
MRQLQQVQQLIDQLPGWAQLLVGALLVAFSVVSIYARVNTRFGARVFSRVPPERLRTNYLHVVQYTLTPVLVTIVYVGLLFTARTTAPPGFGDSGALDEQQSGLAVQVIARDAFAVDGEEVDQTSLVDALRQWGGGGERDKVKIGLRQGAEWGLASPALQACLSVGVAEVVLTVDTPAAAGIPVYLTYDEMAAQRPGEELRMEVKTAGPGVPDGVAALVRMGRRDFRMAGYQAPQPDLDVLRETVEAARFEYRGASPTGLVVAVVGNPAVPSWCVHRVLEACHNAGVGDIRLVVTKAT